MLNKQQFWFCSFLYKNQGFLLKFHVELKTKIKVLIRMSKTRIFFCKMNKIFKEEQIFEGINTVINLKILSRILYLSENCVKK